MRLFILCFFVITGCNNISNKPVKYILNNEEFSCTGKFINRKLENLICYNHSRDTILIEEYDAGVKNGRFIRYFDEGNIKQIGQNENGQKNGIWKSYYSNGIVEYVQFFKSNIDTIPKLIYEKHYKSNGDLISCSLPIHYSVEPNVNDFKVNMTYRLHVILGYSEYENVNCVGFIDKNIASNLKADSVLFTKNFLIIDFKPKSPGRHSITGTLFELDGNQEYENENTIAEAPFKFEYIATN